MSKHKTISPFSKLLNFLDQMETAGIPYDLKHVRETIMVVVNTPVGYWEIEFFENGEIEVELFKRKHGVKVVQPKWLKQFIEKTVG